jgi:integrase/recombinase XerD
MKKENVITLEEYVKARHTKETTKTYLYEIGVFLMKHPKAKSYQYSDLIEFFSELSGKKDSKKEKEPNPRSNVILGAIKKYYDYLVFAEIRQDHPCKYFIIKRDKKEIQIQDFFTPAELQLLFERENRYSDLELRNKVVISLLVHQALASSELVRLELKDIDLAEGTIYVKGSKKLDARTLPLEPSQILLFQDYIAGPRAKLVTNLQKKLLVTIRGVEESVDGINSMIQPLKPLFLGRNLNPTTIRQSVIANKLNVSKLPLE